MRTCQANLNVYMEKLSSKTSQTILKKKYKVGLVQLDCKVLFTKRANKLYFNKSDFKKWT